MGVIHWAEGKIEMNFAQKVAAAVFDRLFGSKLAGWSTVLGGVFGIATGILKYKNLIPANLEVDGYNVQSAAVTAGTFISGTLITLSHTSKPLAASINQAAAKVAALSAILLALLLFPVAVKAQTTTPTTATPSITISASANADAVYCNGGWQAATHETESVLVAAFGKSKANNLYGEGHELIASGCGFTYYGAGAGFQPNLASFFKNTVLPPDLFTVKFSAAAGNWVPTVTGSNSHITGLFNGQVTYQASSSVSINVLEAGVLIGPAGKQPYLSAGFTKYF